MERTTTPTKAGSTERLLADALIDVIADRGLEGTSVREVAAAAGVSIGAVQHHFPTKDAMLLAAFRQVVAAIESRVAGVVFGPDVASNLRRAVHQLLPLDDERCREGLVYLAFASRASRSAELRELQHASQRRIVNAFTAAFTAGGVPRARTEAQLLVALADGLLMDCLSDPEGLPPQRCRSLLDHHLKRAMASAAR